MPEDCTNGIGKTLKKFSPDMESKDDIIEENSAAVQSHLALCQSIIQRMASNSAACKGWCITIVSAVLVLVADKAKPEYALIALIPNTLFLFLDTYYLSLEKRFRNSYNNFIERLHKRELCFFDLYALKPEGAPVKEFFCALISFSVWPFYLTLLAMVMIAKKYVI